jgi:hypothetical protein
MFKKAIPTTAAALAGFAKVRADLQAVKDHHDAEEKRQLDIASAANTAANESSREAREAVTALARFEAILGL